MIAKQLRADVKGIAQKCAERSGNVHGLAVYYTLSTGRLRCAGGSRRGPLEAMRTHGRLELLGVYGRPWPDASYHGAATRAEMLAAWMLEDLEAVMSDRG